MVCEPEFMNMGPLNYQSSVVPVHGSDLALFAIVQTIQNDKVDCK